jgi:small subunit ribosomal protein S3
MSHKVHPKSFRLREMSDWDSRWFSEKETPRYLEEDFKIRDFLTKKFKDAGI